MERKKKKEPRLKVFQERFELLRKERNLSNTEFAKFLEMSRQTVGFYLNGERIPDALTLRQIAEKCSVSVDWLLGLSGLESIAANEETAKSLNLPEKFVKYVRNLRDSSLLLEEKALDSIISSDEFSSIVEILSSTIAAYMKSSYSLNSSVDTSIINDVFCMDEHVRNHTNGVFCVCRCSWIIDGFKHYAQEEFNKMIDRICNEHTHPKN